jgi:NADH-quinone oxidoreductase subunit J
VSALALSSLPSQAFTAQAPSAKSLAPSAQSLAADAGHHALAVGHPGFLSPTGVEIVFLLVGLVTLGAALITVVTRQLVHAALWLVVALGGVAVEYLLLTAEFIAWVQVLIYVGSVVVLILFGLMLTKAPIGRSPDADSGNRWIALVVALAAAVTLVIVVVDAFRSTWINLQEPAGPGEGSSEVTGIALFRHWVLPFEALSVLLLAALVGAIVLSRRQQTGPSAGSPTGTTPKPRPNRTDPDSSPQAGRKTGPQPARPSGQQAGES